MGASHIKDQNISIFMTLNKEYYMAGAYVQGEIYIRAKVPSAYTQVVVGIQGEEYVYWTEGYGKNKSYHRNNHQSYAAAFSIWDFGGNVGAGDYSLPFSVLLPQMMCGSFFHSKNCFIKYTIKAQLVHPTEPKRTQFYSMFLNILQPPRQGIQPLSQTLTANSKCCGCCKGYGVISTTMNSDRNFVLNGELLQINGNVDNSRSKQDMDSMRIMLERRRFMVSRRGRVKDTIEEQFEFFRQGTIRKGEVFNFNFTAKIPQSLLYCTAIGKVASMYYVLHLYTEYGCCANKPNNRLHLIFHSRTPMIVKPQVIPPPVNWYPQHFQRVGYQNMPPYIYTPDPKIPFTNQVQTGNTALPTMPTLMSQESTRAPLNENPYDYKPVFYNQDMIDDAHQEYVKDQGSRPNNKYGDQSQVFKRV